MKQTREHISLWQLLTLTIIFFNGSSIVVGIGTEAKQDAWIAVLMASVLGVLLTYFYWLLLKRTPGHDLLDAMEHAFGKWLSRPFIVAYALYFLYIASRVLRDFGELISSSILVNTPVEVISITMMLVIIYILYLGMESLCRTAEVFSPYFIAFLFLTSLLIFWSGMVHMKNLKPILPDGFRPVLDAVFPDLLTFPFGEMIVITLLMARTSHFRYVGRVSIAAVAISGILLAYATAIQIAVLGVGTRERSNFPLLSAARDISVGNFIERVDALVVFIMMLGLLIKVSVFFYGSLKGIERIFRIPYRQIAFPLGMALALLSILNARDYAEHIEEGLKFVPLYLHVPFQIGLPVLLYLLLRLKQRKGGAPS